LGKCEDDLVRQFVANPRARLDASCVAQEVGTIFQTRGLELQRLVFTISDSDAAHGVAGEWEAWVPGPQIVTTVELRVTGDSVVGTIVQPRNKTAISEGRFERGTLLFKATSANGDRTLTVRGTIAGDEIHFVRDITVRPGGDPGGEGFFGIRGPQTFVAKRRD
jgi:hypothetical protein